MLYAPGDFSFINDVSTRSMLDDAYKAVTLTESWNFMAEDPGSGGFMYSRDPRYTPIGKALKYDGHSGTSYGWTMRQIQMIANIGWEAYTAKYLAALPQI